MSYKLCCRPLCHNLPYSLSQPSCCNSWVLHMCIHYSCPPIDSSSSFSSGSRNCTMKGRNGKSIVIEKEFATCRGGRCTQLSATTKNWYIVLLFHSLISVQPTHDNNVWYWNIVQCIRGFKLKIYPRSIICLFAMCNRDSCNDSNDLLHALLTLMCPSAH